MNLQRITMNLNGAKTREEKLDGRDYLVVPTVMLTEGVHNGSEGPIYYSPIHIAQATQDWNYRPIVYDHPEETACDPNVIRDKGLGTTFNTQCDGRWLTEAWLDKDKTARIAPNIIPALKRGEMLPVSTGIRQVPDNVPGTWNGEMYKSSATNIRPDHLAIMPPGKPAACSIADGAGLLRNAAATGEMSHEDIREQLRACMKADGSPCKVGEDSYCYVADVYPKYCVYEKGSKSFKIGYKIKNGKVSLDGEPEEVRKLTTYITANHEVMIRNEDQQGPLRSLPMPSSDQLSDVMKRQLIGAALTKKYSGIQQEGDWGGWITDLYANYVVWSKDGKLFRLPYTYDDAGITFTSDTAEEVERMSTYQTKRTGPIDGTQSPYSKVSVNTEGNNVAGQTNNTIHQGAGGLHDGGSAMAGAHQAPGSNHSDSQVRTSVSEARKAAVSHMIGDGKGKWGEMDRAFLEGLPDDHFAKVGPSALKGATQPIIPYTEAGIGDRSNAPKSGTTNGLVTMSEADWMASAPPNIRNMVQRQLAQEHQHRLGLIQAITTNSANVFHPDFLNTKPTQELEGMVMLLRGSAQAQQQAAAQTTTQNYAGQGEVPMFLTNTPTQTNNAADEVPVLPLPGLRHDSWGNSRVNDPAIQKRTQPT